jgi:hypothetical protein
LLLGFWHKRVLVDVEYTPNLVKQQVVILTTLSLAFGFLLHPDGKLNNGLGDASGDDFQLYDSALTAANIGEVDALGHRSLAHDQEPGERLTEAPATAEAIFFLHACS